MIIASRLKGLGNDASELLALVFGERGGHAQVVVEAKRLTFNVLDGIELIARITV